MPEAAANVIWWHNNTWPTFDIAASRIQFFKIRIWICLFLVLSCYVINQYYWHTFDRRTWWRSVWNACAFDQHSYTLSINKYKLLWKDQEKLVLITSAHTTTASRKAWIKLRISVCEMYVKRSGLHTKPVLKRSMSRTVFTYNSKWVSTNIRPVQFWMAMVTSRDFLTCC